MHDTSTSPPPNVAGHPDSLREHALAHCGRVLASLEQLLCRPAGEASSPGASLAEVLRGGHERAARDGLALPDWHVAQRYGLSPLDQQILWLALAPQLEPRVRRWIAQLTGNPLYDFVTPELCLDVLLQTVAERLRAQLYIRTSGRLCRSGLLRLVARDGGSTNPLLHELVPAGHLVGHYLGTRALSRELDSYAQWVRPLVSLDDLRLPTALTDAFLPVLEGFYQHPIPAEGWHGPGGLDLTRGIGLLVSGPNGSGRLLAVRGMAQALDRDLIVANGARLHSANASQAREAIEALFYEAELYAEPLVFRHAGEILRTESPLAEALAECLAHRAVAALFLVEQEPSLHPALEAGILMRQSFLPPSDRRYAPYMWQVSTPADCLIPPDIDFEPLTDRLQLSPTQVRNAAHLAYLLARSEEPRPAPEAEASLVLTRTAVEAAARAQVARGIGQLAEITQPNVTLADIVLAEDVADQLGEVLDAVRNRRQVLEEWGLGQRIKRGVGICCLFDGDPGTGKTLAAEIIAAELGLNLVRINAAEVVDKYIGETEKNLTRIFSRTRPDTHLLLFDEADSLFSKRTEVSRASDRYANLEINLLLQLLERYEGVTILTTNLKRGIDEAFGRRFTFKVHFPRPEQEERERLWRYFLAGSALLAEAVDFGALSRIELSGGEIKNAVVKAAYAAARDGQRVDFEYLCEAAEREAVASGHLVRTGGRPEKPQRLRVMR